MTNVRLAEPRIGARLPPARANNAVEIVYRQSMGRQNWRLGCKAIRKATIDDSCLRLVRINNSAKQQINPIGATILIGPEGGFSEDETEQAIASGFQPVSLGPRILRTETAALAVHHCVAVNARRLCLARILPCRYSRCLRSERFCFRPEQSDARYVLRAVQGAVPTDIH